MSSLLLPPQTIGAGPVSAPVQQPTSSPRLPVELWVHVMAELVNGRDFPLAWARCRRVSRFFQKATELAFLSEALPRMVVNLNLTGTHAWGKRDRAILEFKGFSHAGDRVYFADKDRSLKDLAIYHYQPQNGCETRQSRRDVVDWNRHLPVGGAQSPPILVEWAPSLLSISVGRGPTSYYDWPSSRDEVQYAFFPAGTAASIRCHTHYKAAEVSFLWKEMLNISFARFGFPRAQMGALGVEARS